MSRDLFHRHLWTSYTQMARAYGALMLRAWMAFRSSEVIRPDAREKTMFRAMHMPQVALAGLPVAFLPYGLIHWVLPTLLGRFWGERAAGPEDVMVLARLVARYSELSTARRSVDRCRSGRTGGSPRPLRHEESVARPVDAIESYDHLPRLDHNRCLACGGSTVPTGETESYKGDCVFVVECRACEQVSTRRLKSR